MAGPNGGNGDLGFAAELFKAADKLRQNVEPSEYKHIVLKPGVVSAASWPASRA